MFKFGAHRKVKPKGFKFNPRVYDPKKEELERRRAAFEAQGTDTESIKERMSKSMRTGGGYIQHRRKYYGTHNRQSNITLFLVFVVLLAAFYWFFIKNASF